RRSCYVVIRVAPHYTPFPYTTLFRSLVVHQFSARLVFPFPSRAGAPRRPAHLPVCPRLVLPRRLRRRRSPYPPRAAGAARDAPRSEEHTSELQSRENLVCRLLLEKKK